MKILLIQADTTQTLPIAKSLSKKGWSVDIIVSSKWTYGYGSKYANKKFIFQDYQNIDHYFNFIQDIVRKENYNILIPMADESAHVLSKYKYELLNFSKFIVPDYNVFREGYDKHKLMEWCNHLNIPHPKTISVVGNNLPIDKINNLKFPLLIKPNVSCGARGITLVSSIEDLKDKFFAVFSQYGDCHIQEFIQEGGKQVKVQIYINDNGELVQSSVISKSRWYPNRGGSSCCNESIENKDIVNTCLKLLKEIGWIGFADFDTVQDPRSDELLIMELNPRVPACIKTAFEAGIDWADVISMEYLGKIHKFYDLNKTITLRHLGFDVLWFINAGKKRWNTKPSWFNFFGKNIFYQDMNGWSDPMPFIRGTIGNIIKILSPAFRRSKSGMN